MKNKWTQEEINFLIENYPLYGKEYCEKKLNREGSSIFKKASRLKLKVNSDVRLANNIKAQVKYQNDRTNDEFNINIEQFINIQKPEVAYILGFLWADGYIVRNEVRLEIVKDDLDTIKPILESIGYWTYSYRDRNGCRTSGRATTSNKKLKEFLVDHDYDKKSYVSADKILSKMPNDLKHYFFRGLVDGDGCITTKGLVISSTYNQDWAYVDDLSYQLGISAYTYRRRKASESGSTIEINGKQALIACDYIYNGFSNDNIGLIRKHDKYLTLKGKIENSREFILIQKKKIALELYNKGIPVTTIIAETGIASTTLRRFINTIQK